MTQPEIPTRRRVQSVLIDWVLRGLIAVGVVVVIWGLGGEAHLGFTGALLGLLIHRFIADLVDATGGGDDAA